MVRRTEIQDHGILYDRHSELQLSVLVLPTQIYTYWNAD